MKKFVAVAGNIGVGKSTLVEMLCVRLGWEPFYEPVTENPYLSDFYKEMSAWSFHSQVFFLTHRLRSHYRLGQHPSSLSKLVKAIPSGISRTSSRSPTTG